MPTFSLSPVTEADFRAGSPYHHRFVIDSTLPAAEVWDSLHSEHPLDWCRGIRNSFWTTPGLRAVGATRTVVLNTRVSVNERYFAWDESGEQRSNAFTVDTSNAPMFRRFGERYTVTPAGSGSQFVWEFYVEPSGPRLLHGLVGAVLARNLAALISDTKTHLASNSVS